MRVRPGAAGAGGFVLSINQRNGVERTRRESALSKHQAESWCLGMRLVKVPSDGTLSLQGNGVNFLLSVNGAARRSATCANTQS